MAAMKYAGKFVRLALGSMLEILEQELVVPLSIKNITWGYDHPLVRLGKDILPPDRRYPHDQFGLFAGVSKRQRASSICRGTANATHSVEKKVAINLFKMMIGLVVYRQGQLNVKKLKAIVFNCMHSVTSCASTYLEALWQAFNHVPTTFIST